jgi:hypothetical protein
MSDIRNALTIAGYYDGSYPADILVPPVTPTLTSLAPATINVDEPTPVVITGTGFSHNSRVWADEGEQITTFIDATHLRYMAQANSSGAQDITVRNGALVSNSLSLDVQGGPPVVMAAAAEQPPADPPPDTTPPADPPADTTPPAA